jgi:hypothetical protein
MSNGIKGIFQGGVPTGSDVERLLREIGTPAPGDVIPYDQIARILGVERKSSRWGSVTDAWRRRLDREFNLLLEAVPNGGFRVLTNSGRVNHASSRYKRGLRQVAKAAVVAARTDRKGLTQEEKAAADHLEKVGATIRTHAATAAREIDWTGGIR